MIKKHKKYTLLVEPHRYYVTYLGQELQCLLKVKEDLGYVLTFQHAMSYGK